MGWINRYRHGRGFGVHSPFAYRLITEVLGEKLAYYDYSLLHGHKARLLYRVACRFQPRRVCAPQAMYAVVHMAVPQSVPAEIGKADFVAFDANPGVDTVLPLLDGNVVVYLEFEHDKALMQAIRERLAAIGHGMVFDNERSVAIVVNDGKLPHQYFAARF